MAEGGGLLNRYTALKPYRGFESLRLRHSIFIQRKVAESGYQHIANSLGHCATDGRSRRSMHAAGAFQAVLKAIPKILKCPITLLQRTSARCSPMRLNPLEQMVAVLAGVAWLASGLVLLFGGVYLALMVT